MRAYDAAGVDEPVRCLEVIASLQEEGPLLWKEHGAPRIELGLPRVGFDLGEVRVGRPVQRQVAGDTPAHVASYLGSRSVVVPSSCGRSPFHSGSNHGIEVQDQAAIEAAEIEKRAPLCQERRLPLLNRRPCLFTAGVLHPSDDVDTPALYRVRLEREALERNTHLDFIAVVSQPPLGLIEKIRTQVDRI